MSWGSIILMVFVTIGIFYILMSISTHPNPHVGFYFLTIGNLMYISAFLLAILGLIIYLYSYNICYTDDHRQTCKLTAFFYILTFIGVIGISWVSFNYHISSLALIGLVLILIGLIVFAFT